MSIDIERTKDNKKANYNKPSNTNKHLDNDEWKIKTSIKFDPKNLAWLAQQFRKRNDNKMPSCNQLFKGLRITVTELLVEKCKN